MEYIAGRLHPPCRARRSQPRTPHARGSSPHCLKAKREEMACTHRSLRLCLCAHHRASAARPRDLTHCPTPPGSARERVRLARPRTNTSTAAKAHLPKAQIRSHISSHALSTPCTTSLSGVRPADPAARRRPHATHTPTGVPPPHLPHTTSVGVHARRRCAESGPTRACPTPLRTRDGCTEC